ncbi:MAG: M48 family metalloprotease [Proteobacteria bacterium]|nr:M48 family metalloprotease [Pseudomonadota bacterium]
MDYFPEPKNRTLEVFRTRGERYFYQKIIELAPLCTIGLCPSLCQSFESACQACNADYLLLSEKCMPMLHRAMRKALSNLNRSVPYELYQVNGEENASAWLFEEHPLITLQGRILTQLDEGAMCALLGHELGHCFLHASRDPVTLNAWMYDVLMRSPTVIRRDARMEDVRALRAAISAYLQCCELSADRIALFATRNLDDVLRLNMITFTGLNHGDMRWDSYGFLKQASLYLDDIRMHGFELGSHPVMFLRAWALSQFARTNLDFAWLPSGDIDLDALEDDLISVFSLLRDCDGELCMEDGDVPAEFWRFGLSACFLLASVDGELDAEEAEVIDRVFASHLPDYDQYLIAQNAVKTIYELAPFMRACGYARKLEVFMLLKHVMIKDGVINPNEVKFIMWLGHLIGGEALWRAHLSKLFAENALDMDLDTVEDLTELFDFKGFENIVL